VVTGERGRLELLRAKAEEILSALPVWDGESPTVLVTVVDPVTHNRIDHRFVPAVAAPQSRRHLHAVPDAS
jgi:hypothetical protein